TLSAILDEQGRMSPPEALEVLAPVCAALAAAHAAGVVHRDVKASNIMVGPVYDGGSAGSADSAGSAPKPPADVEPRSVKLLDFGIAKLVGPQAGPTGLTSEGRQVGTLTIMAPEQLLGGPVDARFDIYALGVLLYRLLTGRLPFDGKNALTLAQQHLEEPAPRPSTRIPIVPALDTLVLRCLQKRPGRASDPVQASPAAFRRAVLGGRRRDPTITLAPTAPSLGVGIYVEVRMAVEGDDLDDALGADAGSILDLAEDTLLAHGY